MMTASASDSRLAPVSTSLRVPHRVVDNVAVDEPASRHRAAALLKRAAPPPETLAWLVEAVNADTVTACDPMPGAGTSAMHRVTLHNRDNTELRVVMRRYVLADYLTHEPDAPTTEIVALNLAATAAVPTPNLVAADPTAEHCDAPTVVMSELDGHPLWDLGHRTLDQLVDAVATIHDVNIADVAIRDISPYQQRSYAPPRWTVEPAVWDRAVEIFHGPIPDVDIGFVHRDFYPGNALWRRHRLTGIIDWQAGCRGPASIDISHCRLNLAYTNPGLADRLRDIWQTRTGRTFHPWADIATIIGALDNLRDTPPGTNAQHAIDNMIHDAVTDLT